MRREVIIKKLCDELGRGKSVDEKKKKLEVILQDLPARAAKRIVGDLRATMRLTESLPVQIKKKY